MGRDLQLPVRSPVLVGLWRSAILCVLCGWLPGGSAAVWADQRPNVLLICVDDLRPELRCFGVDYIESPHIDRLAEQGCRFTRHYVQAPTCGASRYALLTGRYGGATNDAIFQRSNGLGQDTQEQDGPTLPGYFRQAGYQTVSVGKVSHHPGGLGGPDWDDSDVLEMPGSWDVHLMPSGPWRHPRGAMHGLAHGEIRLGNGTMDVYQSAEGADDIYPDGLIVDEALRQLERLQAEEQPFLLAVGLIRPHLPLGAPAAYMQPYREADLPPIAHPDRPAGRTTWHPSNEFRRYNLWGRDPNTDPEFADLVRRHYAACVSYADALVGRLLEQLQRVGADKNTIVVLWGDHGWHLGEHAIWGKHALFEESLRSPLVIRAPQRLEPANVCERVVETIDIFPTLCQLCDLETPASVQGQSLAGWVNHRSDQIAAHAKQSAVSYTPRATTLRTPSHRLILHRDGFVELYDHRTAAGESRNVAEIEQEMTEQLIQALVARFPAACQGNGPDTNESQAARPTAQATARPAESRSIATAGFADSIQHFRSANRAEQYPRYTAEQVIEIADNILLYQRSNGGWPKNWDPLRILSPQEKQEIRDQSEASDTTLDNRTTYTQVDYLAAAYARTHLQHYRQAALRGIDFMLQAQGEHGGWPHAWPRTSGYSAHITFNDDAMIGVLRSMDRIAAGKPPYDFVPASIRARAQQAAIRGRELILKLQIVVDGVPTAWAQQYDPQTLQPTKARSYELPSIVSSESVGVIRYLMEIEPPDERVIQAVEHAVAWLKRSAIQGLRIEDVPIEPPVRFEFHTARMDRVAVADPQAPPIWARYYEIETNRPFMANRDGTKVYSLAEVDLERRTGYGWYSTAPARLLDREYPAWQARLASGR